MTRAFRALALGISLVTFLLPVGAAGQSITTIRVVGPPNDGFKAVFYGVQSGLFRKYGLNVQTSIVASGAAAAAALSGGSAEVAYTNILTLIQAHTHAIPMEFVAGGAVILDHPPTMTLVLKDSPIKTGRDMNGKTLGSASLRDINSAATLAWVDKNGGDSKSLRVIEVPASAGTAFLEEHRADAVTLNEPAVSLALATGKVRILASPYDAVGKNVMTAGFAAMGPVIAQNRELMTKFARAMHEASDYTNNHLQQTIDLVAAYSGVTTDVVAHSVRFIDAEYIDPKSLQPVIDLCASYGLIDKTFPARDVISSVTVKAP
jgi:NitT/TauT family transport system substrate-binding protein